MSVSKQNFINQIATIAINLCSYRKKWVLPSVTIAQACCESAFGTSKIMATANGLFGFKVGKGYKFGSAWKGKSYSTQTKEFYSATATTITDNFRAYDTVDEAVEDYMDLICSCSRYSAAVNNKDALATITAIKMGGYATSPSYINTIMNIIRTYDLTKFDLSVNPELILDEYIVGKTYTLQSDLYVRDKADGAKIPFGSGTTNAQKNGKKDNDGNLILKKGTKVTCRSVEKLSASTWLQIPSGWICAKNKTKYFVN